ncbi:MAG: SPASM domain-containing protein [Clostridia bacterium]|nr:SPASM domain-containing protein [Clostridia bacterium]
MKRQKKFIVNGEEYIFDGTSVSLMASGEKTSTHKLSYREPNSQRSSNLKTLCLVINNSCNLCCEYCFANKGKYDKADEFMAFETAKKAIDFLINSATEHSKNKITISFFGGEPLLNFKLIKKCVEYIETFEKIKCDYMLTTNGTLLTPEKVKFLQYYNFDIMISLDGNKEFHNFYRKYHSGNGSYNDVVKGIELFTNKNLLNARITINNHNPEIHSYVDDILELGIKRITFAVDYNISAETFYLFMESLKKLMNKYYNDIMYGNYYDITNFSSVITTIALHQRKLTFCNAGISYLTVSADGKYYRCPRFVGKYDFLLEIVEETDKVKEKIEIFKKTLKNNPGERNIECKNCIYTFICGGMCYHHAIMAGKNEFENVPQECYQRQILFEGIIELICKLPTEKRRELLLFYTKLWNTMKGDTPL